MREYRIIKQIGNARSFTLWTFTDFNACYFKLIELINNQSLQVNKHYYVFNDIFDNQMDLTPDCIKYWIETREVNEWVLYSQNSKHKNNIFRFYE